METTIALGQSLSSESFRESLLEVIQSNLEDWRDRVELDDLGVHGVDSSLTNQLCIVRSSGKAGKHDSVIVRIFGENTDQIIDRESERRLNESLVKIGFECSAFLGYFGNGRIESFINGKACNPEDFTHPLHGQAIARSLAPLLGKLHSAVTPEISLEQEHTISRGLEFLSLAEKISFPVGHEKAKKLETINMTSLKATFHSIVGEVETVKSELGGQAVHTIATQNTIIHGDLLCGNILVDNTTPLAAVSEGSEGLKLWLIDMEYSGVGAPVYDIGNHFNEWLGYDVDIALYPSREVRLAFYRDYLDARAALSLSSESGGGGGDNYRGVVTPVLWQAWAMDGNREEFLEQFDRLVLLYGVLSHLYWAAWSVTLSPKEPSEFDYLQYAQQRYDACLELDRLRKGRAGAGER